jgi:hypothetical protein
VLLLLGGREIPPGMSGVNVSSNHHHKVEPVTPADMSFINICIYCRVFSVGWIVVSKSRK